MAMIRMRISGKRDNIDTLISAISGIDGIEHVEDQRADLARALAAI